MVRLLALLVGFMLVTEGNSAAGFGDSEIGRLVALTDAKASSGYSASSSGELVNDEDDDNEGEDQSEQESSDDEGKEADSDEKPESNKSETKDKKRDEAPASADEPTVAKNADEKSKKPAEKQDADEPKKNVEKKPSEKQAATKKEDKKSAEVKKPETYKVTTKKLEIDAELDGVFVAKEMEEVSIRPEVWSSFKVVEAVAHGSKVRKGDVLVKFDVDDIDKAIAEKSLVERMGELSLMAAEEEFPRHKKAIEIDYELAKRSYDEDVQEYERFQKTMRALSEKIAKFNLKAAEQELDNAQEELTQLKKMYEADEITEETEEIVLRRQEFQVEMAKVYMEYSQINHDYTMNISIPRREELLTTAIEQSKLSLERAQMLKSLGLSREQYEMQSLREARERAVEKHAQLLADRALMVLRAPRDGIAYYGKQVDGRWIEVGSMESRLVPFGSVSPNSVVMTIVDERPAYVETSVSEKDFPNIKPGQSVTVVPVADADVELKGSVEKVGTAPGSGNKFRVKINLASGDKEPEWLTPGMTGKSKVRTYEAKNAVVIPADLLQSDEGDAKKKYVMVQVEDEEKPVRRDVKVGKAKEKEVEILKGLKAGDLIVKGAKDKSDDEDDGAK